MSYTKQMITRALVSTFLVYFSMLELHEANMIW